MFLNPVEMLIRILEKSYLISLVRKIFFFISLYPQQIVSTQTEGIEVKEDIEDIGGREKNEPITKFHNKFSYYLRYKGSEEEHLAEYDKSESAFHKIMDCFRDGIVNVTSANSRLEESGNLTIEALKKNYEEAKKNILSISLYDKSINKISENNKNNIRNLLKTLNAGVGTLKNFGLKKSGDSLDVSLDRLLELCLTFLRENSLDITFKDSDILDTDKKNVKNNFFSLLTTKKKPKKKNLTLSFPKKYKNILIIIFMDFRIKTFLSFFNEQISSYEPYKYMESYYELVNINKDAELEEQPQSAILKVSDVPKEHYIELGNNVKLLPIKIPKKTRGILGDGKLSISLGGRKVLLPLKSIEEITDFNKESDDKGIEINNSAFYKMNSIGKNKNNLFDIGSVFLLIISGVVAGSYIVSTKKEPETTEPETTESDKESTEFKFNKDLMQLQSIDHI